MSEEIRANIALDGDTHWFCGKEGCGVVDCADSSHFPPPASDEPRVPFYLDKRVEADRNKHYRLSDEPRERYPNEVEACYWMTREARDVVDAVLAKVARLDAEPQRVTRYDEITATVRTASNIHYTLGGSRLNRESAELDALAHVAALAIVAAKRLKAGGANG